MNTQFIKILRIIGAVAIVAAVIFLLNGAYVKDVFDGKDLIAISMIIGGIITFFLKEKDNSMYIYDIERYW